MMASDAKNPELCRRKALRVAISSLCSEVGFTSAEESALETMIEMLQSFISEVGRSGRAYCELAGRTEPLVSDISLTLIDMGLDIQSIESHSKRPSKMIFMPPLPATAPPQPKTLGAGVKKPHPTHVPDHLPTFPDPHTYIRTACHKPPPTEYQLIREKAASQKRDVECALTKFIAKTGETESLFADDPYAFPLIANKPKPLPYLDALLPKEEDLDTHEQEEEEANKKKEQEKRQKEANEKAKQEAIKQEEQQKQQAQQQAQQQQQPPNQQQQQQPQQPGTPGKSGTPETGNNNNQETNESDGQIDNPYLRAIKMPKLKGKKSHLISKW